MTISIYATLEILCSRHISALDKINTVYREMVPIQCKTEWKECDEQIGLGIISD